MLKFRIAKSPLKRLFSQIITEDATKEAIIPDLRKCYTITQSVEVVAKQERFKILQDKLKEHTNKNILILCGDKESTSYLKDDLKESLVFPRTLTGVSSVKNNLAAR